MSAVLSNPPAIPPQESPGLWALAWRRLRQDAVGMASLVVVIFFLLMMAASYTGLIAKDWSKEKGVSYANPSFMAGAENLEAKAMAQKEAAKAPPVDLSDIDPLAPRYKEWEERAAKIAVTEVKRSDTLPLGGDKWGRDVLKKVVKGSEVSIFVGLTAAILATIIGTVLGAMIFSVIISGFTSIRLDPYYQEMVKGAIIVGAVILDQWRQRRSARG